MNRFVELIKEHPVPVFAGGIALFIFLYIIFSRGGSSGGAVAVPVQTGPSDAVQQASIAASVQQAGIQAQAYTAAQQLQAQYNDAILKDQLGAQVALAQNQGSELQTTTAGDVALAQLQSQTSIANNQTQGQVDIANLAAQEQTAINEQNQQTQQLQISSSAKVNSDQIAAAEGIAISNNQTQANEFATSVGGQVSLADIAAGVQNKQIDAQVQTAKLATDLAEQANNLNFNLDTTAVNDQYNLNSQYLQEAGTLTAQQQTNQNNQYNEAVNLVNSGVFNKGGNGGANQTAAFEALVSGGNSTFNPYPAAIASDTGGNSFGGIIQSFGSLFSSVGKGIVGGLTATK